MGGDGAVLVAGGHMLGPRLQMSGRRQVSYPGLTPAPAKLVEFRRGGPVAQLVRAGDS